MNLILMLSFLLPYGGEAHDFHVSTANMAVEKNVAVCRIRFFRDDLESTLSRHHGNGAVKMSQSAEVDAVFTSYFEGRFSLQADGLPLKGQIIDSGQDLGDREPVWWYTIQFEADAPIQKLRVRNTLLFDAFEDQQNILKVVRFPDQTQRSYSFTPGEDTAEIVF